ncbi:Crp/Fnr family transcriptional regulator [Synechocystis sp. LKSZ1]|uniref:Crp/Fnr family transcriptional regulator n=1 Tax=Synechocystis sp. LKSZ1 TaxID=3144951 RepID=UPI00336BBCB5
MEPELLGEQLPLFSTANRETLAWILSLANPQVHPPQTILAQPDNWGREVAFILSGWVQVCTQVEGIEKTLDIFGQGSYFGTMAVLDDYPPLTQVVALSEVRLLVFSAQRFLQLLLKDSQIQQRMLKLTTQRVRHLYRRLKSTYQSPQRQLMKTLVYLAENYGRTTDRGVEIFHFSKQTLADLVHTEPSIIAATLENLEAHQLLRVLPEESCFCLPALKQLHHFSKQF